MQRIVASKTQTNANEETKKKQQRNESNSIVVMTSELVISDQCICQGALLVQVSTSLPCLVEELKREGIKIRSIMDNMLIISQPVITCSKLTKETPE